jgi:hypothetical protein
VRAGVVVLPPRHLHLLQRQPGVLARLQHDTQHQHTNHIYFKPVSANVELKVYSVTWLTVQLCSVEVMTRSDGWVMEDDGRWRKIT